VLNALKSKVKTTLHPDSLVYNGLAWIYSYLALKPGVRRAAYMRVFKDWRTRTVGEAETHGYTTLAISG